MVFCDAGPYQDRELRVLTVGGGITTPQLLYALKMLYFGGVKINPDITQERFPAGDGPARLVVCTPHYFSSTGAGSVPNSTDIPTIETVLEKIGKQLASWESAYRYFLTFPLDVRRKPMLLWVDTKSDAERVEVIEAIDGGDAPMIRLTEWWKKDEFPDHMLFFSERSLETERDERNPFSPR